MGESAPMFPQVVFTCVTEPEKKFVEQSARLLMSLRWFGGSVAQARFVLGTTGELSPEALDFFEHFGAKVVSIDRYDASHGPGNKIALLGSPSLAGHDVVLLLDCDTVIVQDPSRWLTPAGAAAKPADIPTVTLEELEEIFRFCDEPMPAARYTHELSGDPCIAYCNSGAIVVREEHRQALARAWDSWNRKLYDAPEFIPFNRRHLNQASLAVALETSGIPFEPLPTEMNMPIHLRRRYPDSWHDIDPTIIHYHWLAYPNGFLKPSHLEQCDRRLQSFNARLRAERHVRSAVEVRGNQPPPKAAEGQQRQSAPKVVVGSGWWCDDAPHEWSKGSPATQTVHFFDLWYWQVRRCLRPDRIVVTDSAAPLKPDYRSYPSVEWIELDRNYGHPNDVRTGRVQTKYSGFTRSVVNGAMYALCCDADYYVYVEQDCLLNGDEILSAAVGDSNADILLGPRTEGGKGIYGKQAAPMLQQSFMVVGRAGLERFIEGILGSPWTDGEVSPEVIMERRLRPFDLVRIPFGRSRPIDLTRSHFYVQHLDENELSGILDLLGMDLVSHTFTYRVPEADPS